MLEYICDYIQRKLTGKLHDGDSSSGEEDEEGNPKPALEDPPDYSIGVIVTCNRYYLDFISRQSPGGIDKGAY